MRTAQYGRRFPEEMKHADLSHAAAKAFRERPGCLTAVYTVDRSESIGYGLCLLPTCLRDHCQYYTTTSRPPVRQSVHDMVGIDAGEVSFRTSPPSGAWGPTAFLSIRLVLSGSITLLTPILTPPSLRL